ncbi:MAG: hypothetical protein AAF718_12645 [Pseudomonadota bacterium]
MAPKRGFWSGMTLQLRFRWFLGLGYIVAAIYVASSAPLLGVTLLMLPVFWSVLVIWTGSEAGVSYGPHSRNRETAFSYTIKYLWNVSRGLKALLALLGVAAVIGGLGWISTENLRVAASEPTLTERAVSTADAAAERTRETARNWYSTVTGWFGSEEDESQP